MPCNGLWLNDVTLLQITKPQILTLPIKDKVSYSDTSFIIEFTIARRQNVESGTNASN